MLFGGNDTPTEETPPLTAPTEETPPPLTTPTEETPLPLTAPTEETPPPLTAPTEETPSVPTAEITIKPKQTNGTQQRYINIVETINKKYNEFKKSLYQYAKTQNLTKDELFILIPSNDEPYISENNVDKLIFQKLSTNTIIIGKNDYIADAQIPFYNPKIKINS